MLESVQGFGNEDGESVKCYFVFEEESKKKKKKRTIEMGCLSQSYPE